MANTQVDEDRRPWLVTGTSTHIQWPLKMKVFYTWLLSVPG